MTGKIVLSEEEVKEAVRDWLHKVVMLNGNTRIGEISNKYSYCLAAEIQITDEPQEKEAAE